MQGFRLLLAVFFGAVGMACAAGAQPQNGSESKAPTPEPSQSESRLTEKDAIGLVTTHLHGQLNSGRELENCLLPGDRTANYVGDELWVVKVNNCTFLVNDRTGKVTSH